MASLPKELYEGYSKEQGSVYQRIEYMEKYSPRPPSSIANTCVSARCASFDIVKKTERECPYQSIVIVGRVTCPCDQVIPQLEQQLQAPGDTCPGTYGPSP